MCGSGQIHEVVFMWKVWEVGISWLFTSMAKIWTRDNQEQIQQVARVGLESGTAALRVWCGDHSARLPPDFRLGKVLNGIPPFRTMKQG